MGTGGRSGCLMNALTAFLVPMPSIIFYVSFLTSNPPGTTLLREWCFAHPFLLVNALFFLNIDCLFWIISLLQSSHWMIDLYWTIVPVMLVHYYATHPLAHYDLWRSRVVILMTWLWSIRLTHCYLRRERWQLGAREDWRFADLRHRNGKYWEWTSFFSVYVSHQVCLHRLSEFSIHSPAKGLTETLQVLLTGACLPFYAIHSVSMPLNIWDLVAAAVCCCGIVVAYHADTQLYNFLRRNRGLKELGKPTKPILEKGLWWYSRHPNYFGEQLWWWGLAIFGWNIGQGWTAIGALINSTCLAYVTKLVEDRMVKDVGRAEAYRLYQKTTSVWVPWFKSSSSETKEKGA